jgi:gamma-butyrobetaine dioxygenase
VSAAPELAVAAVELRGDVVRVERGDGRAAELHALALRDLCPCGECRQPGSGQRLFETRDVVRGARVATAGLEDDALVVEWHDGHRSRFDEQRLREAGGDGDARRPTLWGAELAENVPSFGYGEVVLSRAALRRWLAAIVELGFAVLTGAPTEPGTVAVIAELFGHVRATNYGRVFDVAVRVDPANLADTALALSLHTDNPYRAPTPTVQLLHCLASSASGGDTVLADGFRAVARLGPDRVAALAATPIRYAYRDEDAELAAEVPVVELDTHGRPVALRVNNRSKGVPTGTPEAVADWYAAYFELLDLLDAPDARVVFRLEPGNVLVFDNLRVLHGRTAFSAAGARQLQGCYADRDGLLSTLAVLERAG